MAAMGVTTVAECGPGKVLAGLTKRCAATLNGVALADLAALEAAVEISERRWGRECSTDKWHLVTGASRGIGAAIALELGRLGATVIGTATTGEGAATISAALLAAGSG
jgi:3-oxoacyl-ACP reductase-like protein